MKVNEGPEDNYCRDYYWVTICIGPMRLDCQSKAGQADDAAIWLIGKSYLKIMSGQSVL